jgi:hypothetical protein
LFSDLNEKLQEICVPQKEFFEIFTHKKDELKGREFRGTRSKKNIPSSYFFSSFFVPLHLR